MILTSLAFMLTFGAALLWSGVRRLIGVVQDAKKLEAVVWGSVGLVLGAAMVVAGVFLLVKVLPTHGSASSR